MTHEAWNAGKLPEGARAVATADTAQQCCRGPRCNNCPASGETLEQREEVCAAWHALPDDLRKDARLTRLYHALGGPHMEEPDVCGVSAAPVPKSDADYDLIGESGLMRTSGVTVPDGQTFSPSDADGGARS